MKILSLSLTPSAAFLSVVVAQIINLSSGFQPWLGEPLLSATWVWTSTFLCGPVIATIAAWDGAKLFPRSHSVVWNQAQIRSRLISRCWAISTLFASLPTLLILGWMASHVPPVPRELIGATLFTVFAGIATLAILIGGGLCFGSAFGKTYGPLSAFAVTLAFQLNSYLGSTPTLMVGGVLDSLLGLTLSEPAIWLQFITISSFLITEAVFLFICTNSDTRLRLDALKTTLLTAILTFAVLCSFVPKFIHVPRFIPLPNSVGYSCVTLAPISRPPGNGQLCISLQHQRKSPEITQAWSKIYANINQLGITSFPKNLHELPPSAGPQDIPIGPPGETATFTLTAKQLDLPQGTISTSWLANTLISPTWCLELWGEEPPSNEFLTIHENARQALQTIISDNVNQKEKARAANIFQTNWNKLRQCEGLR